MSQAEVSRIVPSKSLSPELRTQLVESTNRALLRIIRANVISQYASKSPSFANFRDAIAVHGTESDTTLLEDFRATVPVSVYESYKPFIAKFNEPRVKESEVMNLLSGGLPNFLAVSSATSGKEPKLLPGYHSRPVKSSFTGQGPFSAIFNYSYRDIKEIVRDDDPDRVVKKVLVCTVTSGGIRTAFGWDIEEEDKRMPLILPNCVSPFAASLIKHYRSFLITHALFTLACRDLDSISTSLSTVILDLFRYMDEEWELFVSSIRDGKFPLLEGVDDILPFLQAHFRANPERAEELREIGSPLSQAGWAALAWPKLRAVTAICSGPFATAVPKIKDIIGPTVAILNPAYTGTEALIGLSYKGSLDTFVLQSPEVVEFLDVASEESHEKLSQAWELEAGRHYEVILTSRDGLWRYRLDDVIVAKGFSEEDDGSPVFSYAGRRSMSLRLVSILITDTQLVAAIQALTSDIFHVHEFTTMVDDRSSPPTVAFFVELAGVPGLGPNSHLARQKLFDSLAAVNVHNKIAFEEGSTALPTIRILSPGTFMEYRLWMGSKMNTGSGQVKVPIVMHDPVSQQWVLEKVVREL